MTIFQNIFSCKSVDKEEDIKELRGKVEALEKEMYNNIKRIEDKIIDKFDILNSRLDSKFDTLMLYLNKDR